MTHADFESIAALDVLGAATAGEASALRIHLLACLPCRRARDEYADATTFIALGLAPIAPPRELRARVASAVERAGRKSDRWWLAVAATLFLGLWVWREAGVRAELDQLRSRNEKLSSEIATMASSPRTIELTGQEIAPAASAKVFIQPDRRRALVFFHDLPINAADKSYQLWIIKGDQPVSAGVFDVSKEGKASISIENLPVETEIKGLAVTLEPRGGVAQPTNTRFIVAGST